MGPQSENPTLGRDKVHSQLGRRRKVCKAGLGVKKINGPLRTMPRATSPSEIMIGTGENPASDQQLQMSTQTSDMRTKALPSAGDTSFIVRTQGVTQRQGLSKAIT